MLVAQVSSSESRVGAGSPRRVSEISRLRRVAASRRRKAAFVFDSQLRDMGQRLQLRGLGIAVERAGGGQRQFLVMDAEAGQVAAAEVFGQRVRRGARVEMPVGQVLGDGAMLRHAAAQRIGQQQFRRAQALEMGGQGVERCFQQAQVAIGEIEPGQAGALAVDGQRQQQAVVALVEQVGVGQRAGRDDACHRTFYRPLASAGSPICSQIATETPSLTSLAR
jgi:hypothetical protein